MPTNTPCSSGFGMLTKGWCTGQLHSPTALCCATQWPFICRTCMSALVYKPGFYVVFSQKKKNQLGVRNNENIWMFFALWINTLLWETFLCGIQGNFYHLVFFCIFFFFFLDWMSGHSISRFSHLDSWEIVKSFKVEHVLFLIVMSLTDRWSAITKNLLWTLTPLVFLNDE